MLPVMLYARLEKNLAAILAVFDESIRKLLLSAMISTEFLRMDVALFSKQSNAINRCLADGLIEMNIKWVNPDRLPF